MPTSKASLLFSFAEVVKTTVLSSTVVTSDFVVVVRPIIQRLEFSLWGKQSQLRHQNLMQTTGEIDRTTTDGSRSGGAGETFFIGGWCVVVVDRMTRKMSNHNYRTCEGHNCEFCILLRKDFLQKLQTVFPSKCTWITMTVTLSDQLADTMMEQRNHYRLFFQLKMPNEIHMTSILM